MASDFNSLMAEMIARARPQQAPTGGRPTVVGGGGSMGSFGGKETATVVSASIDPQGIKNTWRLLKGEQSDETYLTQAAGAHESWNVLNSMRKPEEMEAQQLNPVFQENLRLWKRAGYGGIIETDRTSLNQPIYGFITGPPDKAKWEAAMKAVTIKPGSPEAQREFTRQPTGEEISAGLVGEPARERMIESQKRSQEYTPTKLEQLEGLEKIREKARAEYNPSKEVILAGRLSSQTAQTYIDNEKKLADATLPQATKDLYASQQKNFDEMANLHKKTAETEPSKAAAANAHALAEAELKTAQKNALVSNTRDAETSFMGRATPEERAAILEANKAFDGAVSTMERKYSQAYSYAGGIKNPKSEFSRLVELASLTERHLSGTDGIINPTGTPERDKKGYPIAAANLQYFTQQTSDYIRLIKDTKIKRETGLIFKDRSPEWQNTVTNVVALMRRTVELHDQYYSTPTSKAVSIIYEDALALIKEGKIDEGLTLIGLGPPKEGEGK